MKLDTMSAEPLTRGLRRCSALGSQSASGAAPLLAVFAVGPIVTAFIDFAMVAAVLYFVLMLPMTTLKNKFGTVKAAEPTETELLIEIRDLLAKQTGLTTDETVALSKERASESVEA